MNENILKLEKKKMALKPVLTWVCQLLHPWVLFFGSANQKGKVARSSQTTETQVGEQKYVTIFLSYFSILVWIWENFAFTKSIKIHLAARLQLC